MSSFPSKLSQHADAIEQALRDALSGVAVDGETARPKRLLEAMRYSALDGGKRLRPFLLIECASLFGVKPSQSVQVAAALECIHCYSLVHDDLPSMDDDDLRRGKPTTHRRFDEATAILAGDALLTLSFDMIADEAAHPDGNVRAELVQLYARAAGLGGMVGGQVLDLAAEGKSLKEAEITTLQAMKTGALIRCACEAGAILGGANPDERNALKSFGLAIGQAFQLTDDILDVTSNPEAMGKQTAKDGSRGKGTLVELHGVEATKQRTHALLKEAVINLSVFGVRGEILADAAEFMVNRDH